MSLGAVSVANIEFEQRQQQQGRGRCHEITVDTGAGESVVSPEEWPAQQVRPSAGSQRGQCYVGPGGERIANMGETAVKLRMEQVHQPDVLGKVTFQAAKVRKPLLAVSSMTSKNNMLVFHRDCPCVIPAGDPIMQRIIALVEQAKNRIPLYEKQGVFVMRTWDPINLGDQQQQQAQQQQQSGFTRQVANWATPETQQRVTAKVQ